MPKPPFGAPPAMTRMTFVPRPPQAQAHAVYHRYDYAALIKTAQNGKAVAYAVKPQSRNGIRSYLATKLAARGYRARSTYDAQRQRLIIWCERNGRPPAGRR